MSATLLQRVAANDADAVRECLERYSGLVWSLARRFSRSDADAEDAAQEVFVSLWRSASRFDPSVANEATFVAMIARRRLIDRARAAERRPAASALVEGNDPAAGAVEPRADLGDDATKAARALSELSAEQQRMIRLSVYQGLSHEQIASATGLPLGTVKTHIRRGLMRVREALSGVLRREVAS